MSQQASQEMPPGPSGMPFIGSLFPYLYDGQLNFLETCAEYGDVVHRNVAGNEAYLLFHPDHVEEVMVNENKKFQKQAYTGGVSPAKSCGNPMIDPAVTPWDYRLKNMNPAFRREIIDDYVDVMARTTDGRVEKFASGGPVDIWPEMKKLVLEVAMKTLFGEERVEREATEELVDAYSSVNNRFNTKRQLIPLWAPTPTNWKMKKEAEYLFDVIEGLIESAREDDREPNSLVSVMLAAAERKDDPIPTGYLKKELLTLLVAAQETAALGLTFMWHLVAKHPDVQRRLAAEAEEVLDDGMATTENVRELSYTTRVIKESLRLYPPVFHSSREALEDVTFDGYTIPEGAQIYTPQWVVQRDERWYDDPEEFRPERWTSERTRERPDFAYFPFAGGRKQCIGRTFAMVEMRVILSMLMQQTDGVELLSDEDPELQASLTLKPKNPVEIAVNPSS